MSVLCMSFLWSLDSGLWYSHIYISFKSKSLFFVWFLYLIIMYEECSERLAYLYYVNLFSLLFPVESKSVGQSRILIIASLNHPVEDPVSFHYIQNAKIWIHIYLPGVVSICILFRNLPLHQYPKFQWNFCNPVKLESNSATSSHDRRNWMLLSIYLLQPSP